MDTELRIWLGTIITILLAGMKIAYNYIVKSTEFRANTKNSIEALDTKITTHIQDDERRFTVHEEHINELYGQSRENNGMIKELRGQFAK